MTQFHLFVNNSFWEFGSSCVRRVRNSLSFPSLFLSLSVFALALQAVDVFIKAHRGPAKRIAGPRLYSVCPLSPPYLTLRPLCVCLQLCSWLTEGPANHPAFCTAANNTLHNQISRPATFEHASCLHYINCIFLFILIFLRVS